MNIKIGFLLILLAVIIYANFEFTNNDNVYAQEIVSGYVAPRETPTPTPTTQLEPQTVYKGLASYYSRAGCVGCSKDLLMRNGEPLDDSKLTVAFNHAAMGAMVKITNIKTGQSVSAKVTDTGGFEKVRIPKIIDLSVATKEAIGCGGTCEVEVQL